MTDQKSYEIIKALALGMTSEQTARAENAEVREIDGIRETSAAEIAAERDALRKAGRLI
ncbi:hypothetical protein [Caproicibacter sp.]|uniref:hypothetical protein n=1 Tax=Caproicibacter sp. TaxID=2814884 RepID=UPI00398919E7